MEEDDAVRVAQVRAAIIRYLQAHPLAGDTVEGVVTCWLAHEHFRDASRYIGDVVETMVATGEIQCRQLPDGRVLYVRGPALGP